MSKNKKTIEHFMDGFNKADHEQILSCLTDDIVWEMPGLFRHVGKVAFDKEIENDAFEGRPVITVTRMTEEKDVVIAEGTVVTTPKGGKSIPMVFCDVFEMRSGKISKLISYIPEAK